MLQKRRKQERNQAGIQVAALTENRGNDRYLYRCMNHQYREAPHRKKVPEQASREYMAECGIQQSAHANGPRTLLAAGHAWW
jgi:hypothetical protein